MSDAVTGQSERQSGITPLSTPFISKSHSYTEPAEPDRNLFHAKDEQGRVIQEWKEASELHPAYIARVDDPKVQHNQDGKIFCYQTIHGDWVAELRDKSPWNHIVSGRELMRRRVATALDNPQSQAKGVLTRGGGIVDAIVLTSEFQPRDFRGHRASPVAITTHNHIGDRHGKLYIPGRTPEGEIGYTRIAIASTRYDRDPENDLIMDQITPGTFPDDPGYTVTPGDINTIPLRFEGIATDAMTFAHRDPRIKKWLAQTRPYAHTMTHPYDARNHYPNNFFTGIVAYEIEGGIYVFRLDEHLKRAERNAKALDIPDISRELLEEMTREQLHADKRWIPSARTNIDDPENPEHRGVGNRYYYRMTGNRVTRGPRLTKADSEMHQPTDMLQAVGNPVGPYKDVDMLSIMLGPKRPVTEDTAAVKSGPNYPRPVQWVLPHARKGYHDALFTAPACDNETFEERRLQEGTSCNYIVVKYGSNDEPPTLFIPDAKLHNDILPGINAASVAELASSYGYKVVYQEVKVKDLFDADEVLVTGTAMMVRGVNRIDTEEGRIIFDKKGQQKMGKVGQRLADDMKRIMRREHQDPRFNDWMQRVG